MRTRLICLALAAVAAVGISAAPANAHDELVSSSPAAGEAFVTAPTEVVLEFSEAVLEVGTEVIVSDIAGSNWVASTPVVNGTTVAVPLKSGMPAGAFEILWRAVSSDGHPIEGTIAFTIAESATAAPVEPVVTPEAGGPEVEVTAVAMPLAQSDNSGGAASADYSWLGLLGAVAALGLAAALVIAQRRRAQRTATGVEGGSAE